MSCGSARSEAYPGPLRLSHRLKRCQDPPQRGFPFVASLGDALVHLLDPIVICSASQSSRSRSCSSSSFGSAVTLATHNAPHFGGFGLSLVNPW
jgi:hypothetical protein